MAEWTEFSQRKNGLLLEQVKKKNEVISFLMLMKENDGDHLKAFYEEIECIVPGPTGPTIYAKNEPNGKCHEEQYFAAEKILFRGEFLLNEDFNIGKSTYVGNEEVDNDDDGDHEDTDGLDDAATQDGKDISTLHLKDIREQTIDSLIDEINR